MTPALRACSCDRQLTSCVNHPPSGARHSHRCAARSRVLVFLRVRRPFAAHRRGLRCCTRRPALPARLCCVVESARLSCAPHFAQLPATQLTLLVVCKIKTAPCQVMHGSRPALPSRPPPPASARVPTDSRERSWAAAPPTIVLKDAHGNKQVLEGQADGVSPCPTASDRPQIPPRRTPLTVSLLSQPWWKQLTSLASLKKLLPTFDPVRPPFPRLPTPLFAPIIC